MYVQLKLKLCALCTVASIKSSFYINEIGITSVSVINHQYKSLLFERPFCDCSAFKLHCLSSFSQTYLNISFYVLSTEKNKVLLRWVRT